MTAYDVRVMLVGGTKEVVDLTPFVTSGSWRRVEDSWDEGVVRIGPVSKECCAALAVVRPWLHELRIKCNGSVVFVGPIDTNTALDDGQINANGMLYWFTARRARVALNTVGAGVTASSFVQQIVSMGLSVLDVNLLAYVNTGSCGTIVERKVDPAKYEMCWDDHIKPLVPSVLHVSSFGRAIRFYCKEETLGDIPRLAPHHMLKAPPLYRDGSEYGTFFGVTNAGKDGAATVGNEAGGIMSLHGTPMLVERRIVDSSLTGTTGAGVTAADNLRVDVPFKTSESEGLRIELSDAAPWDVARVQPGKTTKIAISSCGNVAFSARVTEVGASWSNGTHLPYVMVEQIGLEV